MNDFNRYGGSKKLLPPSQTPCHNGSCHNGIANGKVLQTLAENSHQKVYIEPTEIGKYQYPFTLKRSLALFGEHGRTMSKSVVEPVEIGCSACLVSMVERCRNRLLSLPKRCIIA